METLPDSLFIEIMMYVGYGNDHRDNIVLKRTVNSYWKDMLDQQFLIPFFNIPLGSFLCHRNFIYHEIRNKVYNDVEWIEEFSSYRIHCGDEQEYELYTNLFYTLFFKTPSVVMDHFRFHYNTLYRMHL